MGIFNIKSTFSNLKFILVAGMFGIKLVYETGLGVTYRVWEDIFLNNVMAVEGNASCL